MKRLLWFVIAAVVLGVSGATLLVQRTLHAFDAERDRLVSEGYQVLPLDQDATPWRPRALFLTCRSGTLGLSAVFIMPARGGMLDNTAPERTIRLPAVSTWVQFNREPVRLPAGMQFTTSANFIVSDAFDHVALAPLDAAQKAIVISALLDLQADRATIAALERGLYFSLEADADRSRDFLESCGAL